MSQNYLATTVFNEATCPRASSCAASRGHEDQAITVTILPDGRRVLSGAEDKTLRLWDLEGGAELAC
jgi:WD40 repeat protein